MINVSSPHWYRFEDGGTLGIKGSEGGIIIEDEQHDDGGRITLERDCLRVPLAITLTIYGWTVHSRFFADEPTAKQAYEDMKTMLLPVLRLLPETADHEIDADEIESALAAFVARFP